jgi:hypothetical protein
VITRIQQVQGNLSLALQDESVVLGQPATVQVQIAEKTVVTVLAKVVKRQGVDGGWYPAVALKIVDPGGCTCDFYWHNLQDHDAGCSMVRGEVGDGEASEQTAVSHAGESTG